MTDEKLTNISVKKKRKFTNNKEELMELDKEELIDLLIRMDSNNQHLKNIIIKQDAAASKKVSGKPKRKMDFTRCRRQHVFFHVLYLGWDYQGFAVQEGSSLTIEHQLLCALTKSCLIESRQTANYHKCGRTDKGVSSFGQVISLDVRQADEGKEDLPYCKMLNKLLPEEIRVLAWAPVPDNYSARFNCKSRMYRYYFPKGSLDIDAMNEAARYLIGENDYRNLCKMDVGNGVVNFMRTITTAEITKIHGDCKNERKSYDMYMFTVISEGFLWHQIRCIMGVLLLVGEGKEKPSIIKHLLDTEANPRKPQYELAHEVPLDLHCCEYDRQIDWRFDEISLMNTLQRLQNNWMLYKVKTTQIRGMIEGVVQMLDGKQPDEQCSSLLPGPPTRQYRPLCERQKCESLEERIEHYMKKQRIELNDKKECPRT